MKTVKDFINLLQEYPIRQVPRAGQFIVNQMAFEARKLAVKKVDQQMILRNKFVTGRIQFDQARLSRNLASIQSEMGALTSIAFMKKQEKGFVIKPTKGSKVAVPTRGARISKSIQKRKRTIYRKSRLGNIRKIDQFKDRTTKTKKRKIFVMLQTMARKKDKTPALIPFENHPGIYIIRNIRKKASGIHSFKLVMLYDLSRSQVKVKAHPWLEPTTKKVFSRQTRIADIAWQRFLSRV